MDGNQWIMVDLTTPHQIDGILSQGHPLDNKWVTKFSIEYSTDGIHFKPYLVSGVQKVFGGNSDKNSIVKNVFSHQISARYVKIIPVEWAPAGIALRFDILGCYSPTPTVQPSLVPTAEPSVKPTGAGTGVPSVKPTGAGTGVPSVKPTGSGTGVPSVKPTGAGTGVPSVKPTGSGTGVPSVKPTGAGTGVPSVKPTGAGTGVPSVKPTGAGTGVPSVKPTGAGTGVPSVKPTGAGTGVPSIKPGLCNNVCYKEIYSHFLFTPLMFNWLRINIHQQHIGEFKERDIAQR